MLRHEREPFRSFVFRVAEALEIAFGARGLRAGRPCARARSLVGKQIHFSRGITSSSPVNFLGIGVA